MAKKETLGKKETLDKKDVPPETPKNGKTGIE